MTTSRNRGLVERALVLALPQLEREAQQMLDSYTNDGDPESIEGRMEYRITTELLAAAEACRQALAALTASADVGAGEGLCVMCNGTGRHAPIVAWPAVDEAADRMRRAQLPDSIRCVQCGGTGTLASLSLPGSGEDLEWLKAALAGLKTPHLVMETFKRERPKLARDCAADDARIDRILASLSLPGSGDKGSVAP